jgi:hypothetical protein
MAELFDQRAQEFAEAGLPSCAWNTAWLADYHRRRAKDVANKGGSRTARG